MDLKGAEIFSIGTWNGLTFNENDLDEVVRSFNTLSLAQRVPLKFGHNAEQSITDGQPALGWVDRVYRDGTKLFADFSAIPGVVADAIRTQLYKFVSVELLQDAEWSGARYPWVLSAVALLGADPPAVSNLRDLSSLFMSRRFPVMPAYRHVSFSNRTGFLNSGATSMSVEQKALLEQIAALTAQVATFTKENDDLKVTAQQAVTQRNEDKAASIKKEVELKFESAINSRVLLPSARERFFKWTFPKTTEAVIGFDPKDADSYIEENKVKMTDARLPTNTGDKSADEEGKREDEVVVMRARNFMRTTGEKNYTVAMRTVLVEDPDLAERYRLMPDRLFK